MDTKKTENETMPKQTSENQAEKENTKKNGKEIFSCIGAGIIFLVLILSVGFFTQNKNNNTDQASVQTTEEAIGEKYGLDSTEFSSITPKSEYILVDYGSIEGSTDGDSSMHYSVIIDTTEDMLYFAAPGCTNDNLDEGSIMSLIYAKNGDTRKTSDSFETTIDLDENTYPVVAQTKYYKLVQLDDTNYCDVFTGVIYAKDPSVGGIMPVFSADGTLYNYDTYVKENQ